jgi:outer membrane immunogenic protein
MGDVMRKQLLSGVAAAAISAALVGSSLAADVPVRPVKAPPPAALMDWSGFYVGGHLGWGQGKFRATPHSGETDDGIARGKPSGIVGGMHAGQNWQQNTFVYGWEADLSATGWDKEAVFDGTADPWRTYLTKVNMLASLRARLGMTLNPTTLVFLTGGLAYTQAKAMGISPFGGTITRAKHNKFGWVLGLGAEWKQTQNLSWRVEGLWYNFDSKEPLFGFTEPGPGSSKFKDALVVRVGATYHYSDRRLKRDVALLSRREDGVGIYRYRYLWSDEIYVGVMAQEVARIDRDAVACGPGGYLRVNYQRLGLRLMTWDEWESCTGTKLAIAA